MVRAIVDVERAGLGFRYQLSCGHHVAATDYRPPADRQSQLASTCKAVEFCPMCWVHEFTAPTAAVRRRNGIGGASDLSRD